MALHVASTKLVASAVLPWPAAAAHLGNLASGSGASAVLASAYLASAQSEPQLPRHWASVFALCMCMCVYVCVQLTCASMSAQPEAQQTSQTRRRYGCTLWAADDVVTTMPPTCKHAVAERPAHRHQASGVTVSACGRLHVPGIECMDTGTWNRGTQHAQQCSNDGA